MFVVLITQSIKWHIQTLRRKQSKGSEGTATEGRRLGIAL
jgi:hypothetical protein